MILDIQDGVRTVEDKFIDDSIVDLADHYKSDGEDSSSLALQEEEEKDEKLKDLFKMRKKKKKNEKSPAKGEKPGILKKFCVGLKRKTCSIGEVLERSQIARNISGDSGLMLKTVEELGNFGETDSGVTRKERDDVNEKSMSGGVESERTKRAKAREEETMTLAQIQSLAKKKEINGGKLKTEKENKNEKETQGVKEKEIKLVKIEKIYMRRVKKDRNFEVVSSTLDNLLNMEIQDHRLSKDPEAILVDIEEQNKEDEKYKEMPDIREKRERRRVSKYSNLEALNNRRSEKHTEESDIEKLRSLKKGILEILPVEDSDFHDFDKDRRERSFKKGHVWALYDDSDGMPRHYALINEVISVDPFEVTLSWLKFHHSNGDESLISLEKMGLHVSCGKFKVSNKNEIKFLNLFSHIVDCERAATEIYRIYPKKGSVWAFCNNDNVVLDEANRRRIKDTECYDIVLSLSSYSDIYGLSVGILEKVDGFSTVFTRKEVGAHAVIWLGEDAMKCFSHQIPAKKLSGEEALGLPKDCWELDPASLTTQ